MGINLTDSTFGGEYYSKQHHEDDREQVIQRAVNLGCVKFMVTGSDLEESKKAIALAEKYRGRCYATVGVHPCHAKSFDNHPGEPKVLLQELDIAVKVQLPLFLHSRAASEDFERLLSARLSSLPKKGLVHSFTGTMEEMESLVALGLDIGVNGCSMKMEENLDVVKAIPLERLQIETDGPWVCFTWRLFPRGSTVPSANHPKCEMRASHASAKYKNGAPELPKSVKKEKWAPDSMVKGRNESATIVHVAKRHGIIP